MANEQQSKSSKYGWPLSKPLEFLHRVKYGGAVGKLTVIAVSAILVCGVGMISGWGDPKVIFGAIMAILFIVWLSFRQIGQTLNDHPELALMDGTEIVRIREIEVAAKGMDISPLERPRPKPYVEILASPAALPPQTNEAEAS